MNKTVRLSVCLMALFFGVQAFGQTEVILGVNHKMYDYPLQPGLKGNTPDDVPFNLSRLNYYISSIEITHDGGKKTKCENVYLLIDGFKTTYESLGSYEITDVEAISFGIGVEAPTNNDDPTKWPVGHPLAPSRDNEMHWGWAAGYRFVALEGYAGAKTDTKFELHGLGNDYYFMNTIETTGKMVDGKLVIALNADVRAALTGIDVSKGMITHGEFPDAIKMLENFRDHVFSSADGVVSVGSLPIQDVQFYPVQNGVQIQSKEEQLLDINVYGMDGRMIYSGQAANGLKRIQLPSRGVYLIHLSDRNGRQAGRKFVY